MPYYDVLVVGAGPAGLTAAITLARYDLDVLVVERHAGTSPFPKATGVSTRTMELLRIWGLEQRVRAGAMRVEPFLARTPSALNAVQAPGAAGLFVPTSTDDRWIYAREWHPGNGEMLADWTPQRCTDLLRAGTGLPDLDPRILAVMPFVMGGQVATAFPVQRSSSATPRTAPPPWAVSG